MRKSPQAMKLPNSGGELGKALKLILSGASPTPSVGPVDGRTDVRLDNLAESLSNSAKTGKTSEDDPILRVPSLNSYSDFKSGGNSLSYDIKPRSQSLSAIRRPLSPRESIDRSIINDEQRVPKISIGALALPEEQKKEFQKFFDLAGVYLQRGNLDNAYALYQRCEDMITELQKELQIQNTYQHILIRMQIAIILLQKGKYPEAGSRFEVMRGELATQHRICEDAELRKKIGGDLDTLEWWLALSLVRQGRYLKAKEILEELLEPLELKEGPIDSQNEEQFLALAKVRRILALANGYLGDYTEAFRQIDLFSDSIKTLQAAKSNQTFENPPNKSQEERGKFTSTNTDAEESWSILFSTSVVGCQYKFEFTKSVILFLWGDYEDALKKARSAHEGFTKRWGRKHFRTLEVASVVAILYAYNSDTANAKQLCQTTLEAMTTNLGRLHPFTLQSMEVLVYILRAQSRFIEAVDTCTSLCKRIQAALGPDHPQTLRSKSQLAAAALSCGNYSTSAEILEEVRGTSVKAFGERHPDTLRYRSELAQAYCYSWKIMLAEAVLLDVLSKQRSIYTIGKRKGASGKQREEETTREPLLPGLLDDVKDNISTLRVHPDLLFSMQLLAKIESKKPAPDLDLVQDIQQIVCDRRKSVLKQTRETALSLTSEFELAITFREKEDLESALPKFQRVSWGRSRLLGTQHPETLTARHEALVTKYLLGLEVDISDLERILRLREWQLGRSHPDTSQSLLWIFAIKLLQEKDAEAIAIADKLLERLSQPDVRRERLVESLQIAKRVAEFYKGQEHYGKSARVLGDILEVTENSKATSDIAFNLEELRLSAAESFEFVKMKALLKAEILLLQAFAVSEKGDLAKWDSLVQEAYDLYKDIGWGDDNAELAGRSQLAKTIWKSSNPDRKKQAIRILSEILQRTENENILGEEVFKDLSRTHDHWAKYEFDPEPTGVATKEMLDVTTI
jgi:hypothetical protein